MKRISPADYRRLYQRSVPIVEIYDSSYFLDRMVKHEAYSAFRARLYASLRTLFGETTNDYDGFKCSFGYLFGLKLTGEVQQSEYTMIFLDIKGGMNFLFRKVSK